MSSKPSARPSARTLALAGLLLPGALLAACSEYEFIPDDKAEDVDDDEFWPDTGDTSEPLPTEESCVEETLPGYAASSDDECANEIETGTFTPVREWTKNTWSAASSTIQCMSAPIVVHVDDDNGDGVVGGEGDVPEVALVTYNESNYSSGGVIRVVSGADGSEVLSITDAGVQGTGGLAAADIDGDGYIEFVSLTPDRVKAFEHDGSLKWTSASISGSIYSISDVPSITDMDGDGDPEIIAGSAILDASGSILGKGSHGRAGVSSNVGTTSFAADIDGDGQLEVVVGNALYRKDGSTIWYNGQSDGYPAVADFDHDGEGEIVVSGNGQLRMQESDGTVQWTESIPGAGSSYYGGPPTIADFDGDGDPEIGVAAGSRYSVFEADGSILWQNTTDDASSGNTGSAVYDFEGDGVAEVVYADQTRLWVYNGADGSVKLESTQHNSGTWLEYPVIADVDADGHAEIVVTHNAQYGSLTGVSVFGDADDSWMPGRPVWNQHAYSITHVEDDGGIPSPVSSNWPDYNSFRSGDITVSDGTLAPDLTLAQGDLCELDCDDGELWVYFHVGNEGAVDSELPASVEIYAEIGGEDVLLDTVQVDPTIAMAEFGESVLVKVSSEYASQAARLRLEISSDDLECDDTNNVMSWKGPFCQ